MCRRKCFSKLVILSLTGLLLTPLTAPNLVAQQNRSVDIRQSSQEDAKVQKRLALVIGNSSYQHTETLRNPANDASDVARTLRELGFEVLSGINQTKREMEALMRQFGDKLVHSDGVGLFYYAGHGLQVNGENYLVPIDANIPEEDEVAYASVSVNFLLGKMISANNDFNMVILDACRNNPFARSWRKSRDIKEDKGLASMPSPTGTMILYAAQPGSVASDGEGRNGLFTEVLLKYIKQPNLEYEQLTRMVSLDVFNRSNQTQLPYKEGTQLHDFYFVESQPEKKGGCDNLYFDIYAGKINGIAATASPAELKRYFPCFTGESPEGPKEVNEGGGVFFINHDFYFYTYRDYIEVRTNFNGNVSHDLMGAATKKVTEVLGKPAYADDEEFPPSRKIRYFYRTSYGCLAIYATDGEVDQIRAHYRPCKQISSAADW